MGFSTVEMPVHWTNSPASRVRVLRDSAKMFADLYSMRRVVRRTLDEYPYNVR
jgi:hypothetical protein